jgi:hypothetical protein
MSDIIVIFADGSKTEYKFEEGLSNNRLATFLYTKTKTMIV